jgi:hypothetical protein
MNAQRMLIIRELIRALRQFLVCFTLRPGEEAIESRPPDEPRCCCFAFQGLQSCLQDILKDDEELDEEEVSLVHQGQWDLQSST